MRKTLTAFMLATTVALAAPTSSSPTMTVQMVSPTAAECDLQILCVFKYNPAGLSK